MTRGGRVGEVEEGLVSVVIRGKETGERECEKEMGGEREVRKVYEIEGEREIGREIWRDGV